MAGLFVLACAYVLSQFFRSFLAVLTPVLSAELDMSKADFALATGLWFLAFALMQFAVGVSLDRYGPRRTTSWMLGGLAATGGLLFTMATSPAMIIVAMVLIGMGCAPILMASFFIFAKTYPPARFATLSALFIAFGTGGSVLGSSPLAHATEAFGWRAVMGGLTLVTLLIALAINRLIVDPDATEEGAKSGLGGYVELLKMRVLWPIIPLVAVSYAVLAGTRGLWAGPYLTELYGADSLLIGNVTLAMSIAMVVATVSVGPLDRVFGTRKWVAIAMNAMVLMACTGLASQSGWGLTPVVGLFVMIAVFGSGFPVLAAHARGFYPPHLIGRGVTLMNFFSIGGAGVLQFLTGAIVSSPVHADSAAAFSALYTFYAAALGGTLLLYLFSRDSKP